MDAVYPRNLESFARCFTYLNRMTAVDAEKKALLERLEKTSGVSDEERMKRVTTIIQRPVANGQTEVMLGKVPKELFTGHGRAINKAEPGWKTR